MNNQKMLDMEGNQMKMRETMLVVRDALDTISAHEDDIEFVRAWIAQTKEAVQEALAAPARQCDVGTAEEQSERMEKSVCSKHHGCVRCPLRKAKYSDCSLGWAQTPYAEEGAGE